jgi:excisionase family DNA binding protein
LSKTVHEMVNSADAVMTIRELSVYLKVSKSTLYKLAQQGKVPGQKVGKHWRFHKEAIDRWLDRQAAGNRG